MHRNIALVGLGYVGLPVAVAFGRHQPIVGFDINPTRIQELRSGHDRTGEVERPTNWRRRSIHYTDDLSRAAPRRLFHRRRAHAGGPRQQARPVTAAGGLAQRGPGAQAWATSWCMNPPSTPAPPKTTACRCWSRCPGLKHGVDFFCGYSPERINPGDREHTFTTIRKVVSGCDAATLDTVAEVYASVVTAGVHRAPSIKVAEAAKVIENTQRDLNIALMNELSVVFARMGIDTAEVLAAAGSKWNFLPFRPGLVGGHCIGVDPYYLTYQAERLGYIPQVILAGRRINDNMGRYVARNTDQAHAAERAGRAALPRSACWASPSRRTARTSATPRCMDLVNELRDHGTTVVVADPWADAAEVQQECGITLATLADEAPFDALVVAVAHREYRALGVAQAARAAARRAPGAGRCEGPVCQRDELAAAGAGSACDVFRL